MCGIEKPITDFPSSVGPYRSHNCTPCERGRKLASYHANRTPELLQERSRKAKAYRMKHALKAVRS